MLSPTGQARILTGDANYVGNNRGKTMFVKRMLVVVETFTQIPLDINVKKATFRFRCYCELEVRHPLPQDSRKKLGLQE